MNKIDLMELTVKDFHRSLTEKKITCRDLVEFYLDRIDQFDKKGPCINSIMQINPKAREEADKLDSEFLKTGKLNGLLYGVPVLLKDNIETFDMPTTAGSRSMEGYVSGNDSFIVKKLRKAGAIILAKVNLHEFAIWGETVSSILGQTLNPYDLTRTPGGSSGGTGAGIAANFGLIGIGTDTVNSIRSPASANSLAGIRPTMGLVSRSGIVPYSLTQDTAGPICRTVEDAVRTLDVIAGYDSTDTETAWGAGMVPSSYQTFLNKDGMKGRRIGILESFFVKDEIHVDINRLMQNAVNIFSNNGAETVSVTEEIDSLWLTSQVSVHLDELNEHLNGYLATLQNAPVHSLEEIIASGKYHPGIKANLEKALALSTNNNTEYYRKLAQRAETRTRLMKLMVDNKLDALIFPHQLQLVCKTGSSQPRRNGVLCAVTGFPSIGVPVGFSTPEPDAPLGVPIGMEIIGRPFSEPLLIEITYSFEQASRFRKAPLSVM